MKFADDTRYHVLDVSILMTAITWQSVYELQCKCKLQKDIGAYPNNDLLIEAKKIAEKSGVYSFQSNGIVHYVGKFSEYSRGGTSFENRLKQYLQCDKSQKTNLRIFDNINQQLEKDSVSVCVLRLGEFMLKEKNEKNSNSWRWATANDKYVNHAVERLLIAFYKQKNQATWNLE